MLSSFNNKHTFKETSSTGGAFELHSSIQGLEGDQVSLALHISEMKVPLGGVYSCKASNPIGTTVKYSFLNP